MRVHVKNFGAEVEFEDMDAFTQDEELASMINTRSLRGLAPILDEDDDDFDDFDASSFVKRVYQ